MHLLRAEPRPPGRAPALLWVHGGAFRHGSKDSGIARLYPFARCGYVCASIEYRLSSEATWPAQTAGWRLPASRAIPDDDKGRVASADV